MGTNGWGEQTVMYLQPDNVMNPMLFVITRLCQIQEFKITQNMRMGRATNGSTVDILIDSTIVSRNHGEFTLQGDGVHYRDLGSQNGTYINGLYYGNMTGVFDKRLIDGDVIRIDTNTQREVHPKAVIIIYRDTMPSSPSWQYVELGQGCMEINIGREDETSGVSLDDTRVSRRHATFFRDPNGWAVADQNSRNGVYVNNIRLGEPAYLRELDCVRIVDHMFIYVDNKLLYTVIPYISTAYGVVNQPFQQMTTSTNRSVPNNQVEQTSCNKLGANLYINIVKRTVHQGLFKELTLLKDINLTIHAGEMVLILGGSGAGKTTFMNAVMGYEKATGTIRHGNIDIYSQYSKMKYAIGFVPQDVLLRESDTVYDTLYNAAEMKMPPDSTPDMIAQRVEKVMGMVSLSHVANSLIKSISGGEKKRVSAGVELVADPSLFFLDEPDSGLDAQSATELMENLRNIANAGKIVMIISHSPDRAAHLFDKVIVLAKSQVDNSGHLVFFGSVPDTEAFFGVNSLEGVVGKINRRDGAVEQYIQSWKQISANNNQY